MQREAVGVTQPEKHGPFPAPVEGWIAYPVNRRVNDPKNDDPKLIEPEAA